MIWFDKNADVKKKWISMMGHIIQKRIEVFATLSEIVGYKAGLALTRQDIVDHLPEDNDLWAGDDEKTLRIEASEYEELLTKLLFRLGVTPRSYRITPGIVLRNKYQGIQRDLLC